MINPERKVPNKENTPERSAREWLSQRLNNLREILSGIFGLTPHNELGGVFAKICGAVLSYEGLQLLLNQPWQQYLESDPEFFQKVHLPAILFSLIMLITGLLMFITTVLITIREQREREQLIEIRKKIEEETREIMRKMKEQGGENNLD